MPRTGRQIIMERLNKAIQTATTGDLQRAAIFLESAREVRAGCTKQRASSRRAQSTAWKKKTDSSITWQYSCSTLNNMALRHGNKTYFQILLDPHRAEMIQEAAAKEDKRATAWIREAIYSELKRSSPASLYNEAMAKDQAEWRQSIRKRVEGRSKQKD